MSTEIGKLHYDIDTDDQKLDKKLDSSDKKIKSFGDTIQATFRDVSKVLAGVAVGLTAFSKSATDFTVDYVKSAKDLGRTIGVSTTEASRLVAAFGRMGIEASAATQMFGVFSKQIVAATQTTKDSQLSMEKLRIDIDQTKNSITRITTEITKNGDKTGALNIKLRELNNTLATQEQELNKSANAFQKLGITTVDAMGNQKDFNTLLFEVADKFKVMPDGIDKTALSMELFGRQGKDMIKVLNLGSAGIQDLEKQADKLGLTLNPNTIAAVNGLVQSQKQLKQQTDALKIAVGTATAPILTRFNQELLKTTQALMGLPAPFDQLTTSVLAFGGPVAGAASGVTAFLGNISNIAPKVGAVAARLGVVGLVLAAVAAAAYLAYLNWDMLAPKFEEVGNYLRDVFGPAVLLFTLAWEPLKQTIISVSQYLAGQLFPALMQIWDATQRLWQAINPAFTTALKVLAGLIVGVIIAALLIFVAYLTAVIQVFSWLGSALANVINWISNFIGWIGTATVAVARAVSTMAMWFFYLPQAAAGAIGQAINWVASLPSRILNAVGNLGGLLYRAGLDVVQGLINGVKDKAGQLAGAMRDMASSAVNAAKSALKIRSPSRVFAEIGQNVTAGFVEGIKATEGLAAAAMSSMSNAIISPSINLSPAGAGGAAAGVASGSSYGDTIVNIGTVQDRSDAEYIIKKVDRNSQLESMGIAPVTERP